MDYDRKPIFSGQHPATMLFFSSLGIILVGIIFQLIAVLLATVLYNVSVFELTDIENLTGGEALNAIKFLQIVGAIGTFVFGSLLISFFYTGKWFGYFHFGTDISIGAVILIIIIMVVSLPFVNLLSELNSKFKIPFSGIENYLRNIDEQTETLMMTLIRADNIGALLINLFMIAIIPAIGEELVFRGLIQKHLAELFKNGHIAILLAAVIFSLAHFQVYSFLPRFFLGLILGYSFYYGKSIWYPMIAHLVNNGMGVMYYYFYARNQTGDSLEDIGTREMIPVTAVFSLILVAGLMYYWVKMMRTNDIPLPRQDEKDSYH